MARKSFFSRLTESIKKTVQDIFSEPKGPNASNFGKSRTIKEPPEPTKPIKSEVDELQELKTKVQPILDLANKRWEVLDDLGLRSLAVSRAYNETEDDHWGFDVSQLTTKGEVIEEATRARVFINDETSTPQGAELYTQQESYKQWAGQFGNQYNNWENKFKNYNTKTISEEHAKLAFAAYRRLEESEAARIMSYGSENMIIAIYDMVIHQGIADADSVQDVTDVTEMARDLLDRELGERRQTFNRAFQEENQVGNILDIVTVDDDYLGRGSW